MSRTQSMDVPLGMSDHVCVCTLLCTRQVIAYVSQHYGTLYRVLPRPSFVVVIWLVWVFVYYLLYMYLYTPP